jgi:hypothetical protein
MTQNKMVKPGTRRHQEEREEREEREDLTRNRKGKIVRR